MRELTPLLRNQIVHHIVAFDNKRRLHPQGRRRKLSLAYILERIFYVCRTGCQWCQLHVEGSSYKTVYHHFNIWSKARIFEDAFYALNRARTSVEGSLVVDTSFVKNVYGRDIVGRNPTDRGRKASKLSLLTDSKGTPLCAVFHQANKHDSGTLKHLLATAKRKLKGLGPYSHLLGDKGYDSSDCRIICKQFGLEPCIPKRRSADVYRGRYVVEQTFGILDQFRRLKAL